LDVLTPELLLFGEWCAARHSLDYVALPDWFLLFDVYDRSTGRFWSTPRRNALAKAAALATVPNILQGRTTLSALQQQTMSTPSRYRSGQPLEGVIVRRESTEWCEARAKLVRPDFTQAMDIHWRKRAIEWNLVDHAAMAKT
jgi:ATP-dependent RNA circularization protein (DNA/RNA ligase family)